MLKIFSLIVLTIALLSTGCSKGNKCQKTAEQHCSKYSEAELKDIYGSAKDPVAECTKEYAANCEAERKYKGSIPADVVIDPNQ